MPPLGPPDDPEALRRWRELHGIKPRYEVVRVPVLKHAWWAPPVPDYDCRAFFAKCMALKLSAKFDKCRRIILRRMDIGRMAKAFELVDVNRKSRESIDCKTVSERNYEAWTFQLIDRENPRHFVSFVFDKEERLHKTDVFTRYRYKRVMNKESLPKRQENPHPRRFVLPGGLWLRERPGRSVFKRQRMY